MNQPQIDLPPAYDAKAHEPEVYRRWESSGCFRAGAGAQPGQPTYCIMIPPPNVTGVLHMGHALNNTLQDTLIRWQRMQGRDVLWQPGTDHAGIATQAVVARQLAAKGLTKEAMTRQEFLGHVWAWKEQYGSSIIHQLKKMGSSCDWSRTRFTMDEGLSAAVRENFVKLYRAGLIYKGTRMVNWDVVLKTALSDDEVEPVEKDGCLWRLRYPLADGSGHIDVDTTRPETFFGDTGVAVNPRDPRYLHLIGKEVVLPIVQRRIPIVGDEYADPEKGTGAVKITPAHDPNDYEVGKRHNLPLVRCIGLDGTMTGEAAHYAGQERFACRQALLRELKESGVLQGETAIRHTVGHGDRSHQPIEPMVTEQWFVKMRPLAERALKETREDRVKFHPSRWAKVYCRWLEDVQDWCISRQIWWGHRIPAWTCAACGRITVDITDPTVCAHCGSAQINQDEDVLDTWFSSALWPFSTLGWPDRSDPFLKRYYPTSTLVTDRGIIYFWVARMVMMGLANLDARPFNDVYIHGTVLDEHGAKMSKSAGNGIDPLVMIEGGSQTYLGKAYECPGYGADAVRATLLTMTTEGQDLKLSPTRFEAGRNFANKIYNAGRFLLMNLAERPRSAMVTRRDLQALALGFEERWLLDRLQAAIADCTRALTAFRFSEYIESAYRFFRDDLCDWYLEWAKHQFKAGGAVADASAQVLIFAFDRVLKLLHPAMPFLTETLWQQLQGLTGSLAWKEGAFLMLQAWPEVEVSLQSVGAAETMAGLQALVSAVRQVRNEMGLPDRQVLSVVLAMPADAERKARWTAALPFLADRAHAAVRLADLATVTGKGITTVVGDAQVRVEFSGEMEGLLATYRQKLEKQLAAKEGSAAGKRGRLANAGYVAKAGPEKVQETRDLLAQDEAEIAKIRATLAGLV